MAKHIDSKKTCFLSKAAWMQASCSLYAEAGCAPGSLHCKSHTQMNILCASLPFLRTAKWGEYVACSLCSSQKRSLVILIIKRIVWKKLPCKKFLSNAVLSNMGSREELKETSPEGMELPWHLKDPFTKSYSIIGVQSGNPYNMWQPLYL